MSGGKSTRVARLFSPGKALIQSLSDKKNYTVPYKTLKLYVSIVMGDKKVQRLLMFKQTKWMQPNKKLNTSNTKNPEKCSKRVFSNSWTIHAMTKLLRVNGTAWVYILSPTAKLYWGGQTPPFFRSSRFSMRTSSNIFKETIHHVEETYKSWAAVVDTRLGKIRHVWFPLQFDEKASHLLCVVLGHRLSDIRSETYRFLWRACQKRSCVNFLTFQNTL